MEKEKSKYCGCLYYSANALSRVMTKMAEEEFANTGLAPSHAFLLMSVHHKPGIQPGELAAHMQLTPSTVTRLIEKLESKKLVHRQSVGRAKEVFPTEKCSTLMPAIKKSWQSLYQRYADVLGEENARNLTTAIYEANLQLQE
jgi:DNA-binding MarR family transcriptional regulator